MIVQHVIFFLPNFQVHFQLLSQQHSDLCLGDVKPLNRTNGSITYFQGKLAFGFVDVLFLEYERTGYSSSSLNVVLKYGPLFIFQGEWRYVARNTRFDE